MHLHREVESVRAALKNADESFRAARDSLNTRDGDVMDARAEAAAHKQTADILQRGLNDLRAELTATQQRYHELVLKATAPPPPAPPARIEAARPEAEDRARHAVSLESKCRLAEQIIVDAQKLGKTIDYETAFEQAVTMMDYPEHISLET